jgi:hypothetical protein
MTRVGGDDLSFERRRRLAGAVLLILYIVPVLLLPAWHLVGDWLERRGCSACPEATRLAATERSLTDDATPESPCHEPGHHHHNHPLHDAAHCVICSTTSSLLSDRPDASVPLRFEEWVSPASLPPTVRARAYDPPPATLPRAPPTT